MEKLSNTEVELKKALLIKKGAIYIGVSYFLILRQKKIT